MDISPPQSPQILPETLAFGPAPATHMEVQKGQVPGLVNLIVVTRLPSGVVSRQMVFPMTTNYAQELSRELGAPSIHVPQTPGFPP